MSNLEWDERGRTEREEGGRGTTRTFGLTTLGFAAAALLTLLFISIGGPLGAGIGPPILVAIAVAAAVMVVIGPDGSRELLLGTWPPADEDVGHTLPSPAGKERELLSVLRDGGVTPVEAAIETSLTVREADAILSELASAGYLALESRDGALFYSIPGRPGSRGRS